MLSIKNVASITTQKVFARALRLSFIGIENVYEWQKSRNNSHFLNKIHLPINAAPKWFSTQPLPEPEETDYIPVNPNVFGRLGGRKFDAVEMDEAEQKEEEFLMNEARVPRRLKPSAGQYVDMIKLSINKGDLKAAMAVLDLIKKNRDKPNEYMYNLLIGAYAVQGDLRKCVSLYTTMKKRQLKIKAATYVNLLNACANTGDKERAVERIHSIRSKLLEINFPMNEAVYNVLIKAYGRNQQLVEAFEVADEMIDKEMNIDVSTFNSLMYGAISDKKSGLRHCLSVWHMMQSRNIKPDIFTYNLMLRAMRDTQLGDLHVNDILLPGKEKTRITLVEGLRPDLLSVPPVFSSLPLLPIRLQNSVNAELKKNDTTEVSTTVKEIVLDRIQADNKLILFGGFDGFLKRMEKENVVPNVKTLTYLMDLVPNSEAMERSVINYAKRKEMVLDIDFYNMLIKKRCFRHDYDNARAVLHDIQRSNLKTDIITWGLLALTCRNAQESKEFLLAMNDNGHSINRVIAETLINNATKKLKFGFILEVMQIMIDIQMRPSYRLFDTLDDFQKRMSKLVHRKDPVTLTPQFKANFSKFNLRYSTWRRDCRRESHVSHSQE